MKRILVCRVLLLLLIGSTFLETTAQSDLEQRVITALESASKYASEVILDDEGKSRCDYNMTEAKWYPYEEPWHTGQIIYGLLEAYRVLGEEALLTAAKRAGDWWLTLEIKDDPRFDGMVRAIHGDDAGEVIVFATVSDGTAGLYHLYRVTKEDKYAALPTSAGKWMLENMCDFEEGVCYDLVDPETAEVLTQNSPFHREKQNQNLNDVARPNNEGSLFLDMYRYTGDETYKDAFLALCNSLVEKQDEHGLWMDYMPNHKDVGTFHPRFNLWYAESLLDGFDLTGDRVYLNAAMRTMDTYAAAQHGDGTIYYKNYLDGRADRGSICGSSVSFLGLLMTRVHGYGAGAKYEARIELCANWVMANQFSPDHSDPNLRGAFMNVRVRKRKGKNWFVNRDVGTAFGLRFLASYHDYKFQ